MYRSSLNMKWEIVTFRKFIARELRMNDWRNFRTALTAFVQTVKWKEKWYLNVTYQYKVFITADTRFFKVKVL